MQLKWVCERCGRLVVRNRCSCGNEKLPESIKLRK